MSMPAAQPPFTPGLDFSTALNGMDPKEKFKAERDTARRIIEEKLQAFEELQSVSKVTFSDGDLMESTMFIDARSSPVKLLDTPPVDDSELSFEIKLEPKHVAALYAGLGDDAATVVFMYSQRKGNPVQAVRFGDLLTPEPSKEPIQAKELDLEQLPKPTDDVEQVKRDIVEWGYGMLTNALSPSQVAILKQAVQEQAAGERNGGLATFDGGPKKPNQRINNLFNKGDEFCDLMNHPVIDEIVPWYIGDTPLMWSYSANIARPGGESQHLHWDSGVMGSGRGKAVAINISWLLCDVTEKNGGTRIFPGSHKANVRPRNMFSIDGSIAAEAPAGTALIFEGRLWHGTGPNKETSGERPVILSLFCNKGIRPKENSLLSLDWETEDRLSERHKSLCGLRTALAGVGGAAGETRGGLVVQRPRGDEHKMPGKLRAPHDDDEVARLVASGTHADNWASQMRAGSNLDHTATQN